jgi:HPt (histidine-containing phosphotransfer) domain-containing protein
MLEAVEGFIDGLAQSKSSLNKAFHEKQWETALQYIHDVKGAGGAFGYPQLSNVARDIDKLLRKRLYQESSILLSDLNDIYDRIIAGRQAAG